MDKFHIPQHLDEPYKIILWTLDEAILFLIPFLAGLLLMNQPLLGFVIGVVGVFALKKLKGEQGHYYIFQLLYWHLPPIICFRVTPPSYLRYWIGG